MATKKKKKTRRKTAVRRPPRKPAPKRSKKKTGAGKPKRAGKSPSRAPKKNVIGVVTHYFPKVNAAVVKLKRPLAIGDAILIKGRTTSFEQKVDSMQIDHVPIQAAKKGDEIGLAVIDRVREHDLVLSPT